MDGYDGDIDKITELLIEINHFPRLLGDFVC